LSSCGFQGYALGFWSEDGIRLVLIGDEDVSDEINHGIPWRPCEEDEDHVFARFLKQGEKVFDLGWVGLVGYCWAGDGLLVIVVLGSAAGLLLQVSPTLFFSLFSFLLFSVFKLCFEFYFEFKFEFLCILQVWLT
jgi:hypothetical protein